MAKPNLKERIQELEAEKSKLLAEAKEAALGIANSAIAELNELGFSYQIVEGGKSKSKRPTSEGSRTGTRTIKDAECPICHFKTNPIHDARSHRVQSPKRPFTDAELSAKGMTKVS